MNREFLINILLLIGINLLIKPFYLFGIDAKIQYLVGQEAYGVYFALFNFSFLFQIINDPGIQNYSSQKIASEPAFVDKNLAYLLGSKVILGLLFIFAVGLGGWLVGFPSSYYFMLFAVTVNHFLATFFVYLRSNISALGKYRADSFISGLDKLMMVIILGYILYFSGKGPEVTIFHLILTQTVSYVLACCVALLILKNFLHELRIRFSLSYLRGLIQRALPFALVLLLMTIYNRLDGIMLERLLNDNGYQAGVYASCYRFMEALNMVGYLFAALLLPMYARMIKDRLDIAHLADIGLRLMIVIAFGAAYTIYLYKQELLQFLYPYADDLYFDTLTLLMISYIAVSISYIYGTMQVANGTLKSLNMVFLTGVIINIVLNLWLIPTELAYGAAIATAITQIVVMGGQIILSHRTFNLPFNLGLILKVSIWIALLSITLPWVYTYTSSNWIIGFIVSILLSGILALIVRVIQMDMLFSLLARK